MICEKCGNEMTYKMGGHSCVWECSNCGNGLATSLFSEIELDNTTYTLSVKQCKEASTATLKTISTIFSCNLLEARSILFNGSGNITDKALKIQSYARQLDDSGIVFEITPEFPYEV